MFLREQLNLTHAVRTNPSLALSKLRV
ncbi:hypothetical protein BQ8482_110757 [Mesorhizobium delmotii]|uniref:Uncharacterized protein n=1 Tax=Mesorhizobium delmotii TaxID=1631247 RepID=A0A2P9ACJ0_9HYPH|nr:hypothetical protein BQ8482_110757 [Mesorhizobium delmotii]